MSAEHKIVLETLAKAKEFNGDPEAAHSLADEAICTFLNALGYGDVVAAWSLVEKWYA